MRLGSWENSVSGLITSRTTEKGASVEHRWGGALESQGAQATEIFLPCTTWRPRGPAAGFKDDRHSSGVF